MCQWLTRPGGVGGTPGYTSQVTVKGTDLKMTSFLMLKVYSTIPVVGTLTRSTSSIVGI